jgi:hypothetical protein
MKKFEEYIEKGKVKKVVPDLSRAKSIIEEAKNRKDFLRLMKTNIQLNDSTAIFFIENVYDLLIDLIRAKMFQDGYKAVGHGAHEIEIFYMNQLGFSEKQTMFMNSLRENRNKIKYYGQRFDAEYAKITLSFLEEMYGKLLGVIK